MNLTNVGQGNVVLIAGGDKIYTDIAARFCRSEKSLTEILASPYDANIVKNILNSGHKAAVEFDYFIFGVEGFSRVCEAQLIRKRLASFLIKSGRVDKKGKRTYDIVLPESIIDHTTNFNVNAYDITVRIPDGNIINYKSLDLLHPGCEAFLHVDTKDLIRFTEQWYNSGVEAGLREEDLRYMKQQGTEYKAIIGMNAHALLDWFQIRDCLNAQAEIRDLSNKILKLCKTAAPDIFKNAGASCKVLGYCPENNLQNEKCKGNIYTKDDALEILRNSKKK